MPPKEQIEVQKTNRKPDKLKQMKSAQQIAQNAIKEQIEVEKTNRKPDKLKQMKQAKRAIQTNQLQELEKSSCSHSKRNIYFRLERSSENKC